MVAMDDLDLGREWVPYVGQRERQQAADACKTTDNYPKGAGVQITVGGAFGGGFVCTVTVLKYWQVGCGVSAGFYLDITASVATSKHPPGCWARVQSGGGFALVNVSGYVEAKAVGNGDKRKLVVHAKKDAGIRLAKKFGVQVGASLDVICYT